MNFKILTLSVLIAAVFLSAALVTPMAQPIPTNKSPCNTCHASGGVGSLAATYVDGSKPVNNTFSLGPGDTIGITLYGIGAQDQNEPAVEFVFDPHIFHHLTIDGASAGGDGSYAYYVRDGDSNDQDPKTSDVKGLFQITADANAPAGEYPLAAVYSQAGPSGVVVNLVLKITGQTRASSSISVLVSPNQVYADKDTVYISGGIRPANADQIDIQLQSGDTWRTIAVVAPGANGAFFYQWVPMNVTEYGVRVAFEGNKNYAPVESEVFTVNAVKAPEVFINQIETAIGLGLLIILIGIALFYLGGRSRYSQARMAVAVRNT
jgi:hypothetical protein